ncbi:MAG TPA: 16S rRNA (guanine(527)-N(7))-methyltransferase RsmG, partial [Prolixibacteraceae bacterium]|nr:16S rRNA (guanine(527)-N(7))-methyltransferase RsmG [Prolixibacteraceae bacterium]
MDIITKYFDEFTALQISQFSKMEALYVDWNNKINVISRKDIGELYLKHVLHSLSVAVLLQFKPGTKVLDVGCGGGFPGIPLAIMFPEVEFTLVDSIGKKILVVNEVAKALGLTNVKVLNQRAESLNQKFDFIVS